MTSGEGGRHTIGSGHCGRDGHGLTVVGAVGMGAVMTDRWA
jgi:hypothetical protein